jgi:hypothetical protein
VDISREAGAAVLLHHTNTTDGVHASWSIGHKTDIEMNRVGLFGAEPLAIPVETIILDRFYS